MSNVVQNGAVLDSAVKIDVHATAWLARAESTGKVYFRPTWQKKQKLYIKNNKEVDIINSFYKKE